MAKPPIIQTTCQRWGHNFDLFGAGVHFSFQGRRKISTAIGRVATILVVVILVAYGGY